MSSPSVAALVRPKVVFFGSGPVAAESLRLIVEWADVEAVITKPQPPHHREKFPVIAVAEARGLPLHFASNRRQLDEVIDNTSFDSRVAVLIDYGIIISQTTIDSFELGIVNSHFSLLPEWRGADPISFSILSGQAQTGVSLMLLVQAMDEGPLLSQGICDIPAGATTPSLTADLITLSDALLRDAIPKYLTGTPLPNGQAIKPRSQEEIMAMFGKPYQPTYSRKLTKADGVLQFTKTAQQLEREIRAFVEWPNSRTLIGDREVIITAGHAAEDPELALSQAAYPVPAKPLTVGNFFQTTDHRLAVVAASDSVLFIDTIKPAGKRDMTGREFGLNFPLS